MTTHPDEVKVRQGCVGRARDRLESIFHHVHSASQLKKRGEYPPSRLFALQQFTNTAPRWKIIAVILATPLSSLSATTFFEAVPLNPPYAGLEQNRLFFLRELITYFVFCSLLLQQFCAQVGPVLPMTPRRLLLITLPLTVVDTAIAYGIASAVGFPVPFTLQLSATIHLTLETVVLGVLWGGYLRANPKAFTDLLRAGVFFGCQVSMIGVYPIYYYVFTLLPDAGAARPAFFCLLPILRIIYRQLFQRLTRKTHGGEELTPLFIVLNADVLGGLFVAFCMQYKPSTLLAAGVAVIKVLMTLIAFYDVYKETRALTAIRERVMTCRKMETATAEEPAKPMDLLSEVTEILTRLDQQNKPPVKTGSKTAKTIPSQAILLRMSTLNRLKAYWTRADVLVSPIMPSCSNENDRRVAATFDTEMLNQLERSYAKSILKLFYMTEFIMLAEYVEVIVPAFYCKSSCNISMLGSILSN